MLQLFSDAGFYNGTTFATSLIFEDWEIQLAFLCKKYEQLESSAVGEIMGIEQSLQWVLDNRPDVLEIEIYVDNISVAQKLCDYAEGKTRKNGAYPALWMHMYLLCDKFEHVSVYHVPAHQTEYNPNKACDVLCSALLRLHKASGRGDICTQ